MQIGMHTMNSSLSRLMSMGKISKAEALRHSNNPAEFEKNLMMN